MFFANWIERHVDDTPVKSNGLQILEKMYKNIIINSNPAKIDKAARKLFNLYKNFEYFSWMTDDNIINIFVKYGINKNTLIEFKQELNMKYITPKHMITNIINPPIVMINNDFNKTIDMTFNAKRPLIKAFHKILIKHDTNTKKKIITNSIENKNGNKKFIVDRNNSHDSGINASARRSILNISNTLGGYKKNVDTSMNEIKKFLDKNGNHDAQLAFDKIMTIGHLPISTYGYKTEKEILNLIWSRIHHPDNTNRINDLKEIFKKQMASIMLHGRVVCSVGRVNRMISTLSGADANPHLCDMIPTHVAKITLKTNISTIIKQQHKSIEKYDKIPIQELTPKQKKKINTNITNTIKIIKTISKRYVDILPGIQVQNIINDSIEVLTDDLIL